MPERRHYPQDIELTAIAQILSAYQLVPHERREHVNHYVQDRWPKLSYIDPSGQEIPPPPEAAPPFLALPERERPRPAFLMETEGEDKSEDS